MDAGSTDRRLLSGGARWWRRGKQRDEQPTAKWLASWLASWPCHLSIRGFDVDRRAMVSKADG